MARNLVFRINKAEMAAAPVKVDRKKLYGWTELKALDDEGRECRSATMDETGTLIIPKGGMGMGLLSPEREWVERSSLKAVRADGSDAEIIPSSYNAPIDLAETVTPPSQYWMVVYGREKKEILQDAEGMQTIRKNARAMAWLMKMIAATKGKFPTPNEVKPEKRVFTNFVR